MHVHFPSNYLDGVFNAGTNQQLTTWEGADQLTVSCWLLGNDDLPNVLWMHGDEQPLFATLLNTLYSVESYSKDNHECCLSTLGSSWGILAMGQYCSFMGCEQLGTRGTHEQQLITTGAPVAMT